MVLVRFVVLDLLSYAYFASCVSTNSRSGFAAFVGVGSSSIHKMSTPSTSSDVAAASLTSTTSSAIYATSTSSDLSGDDAVTILGLGSLLSERSSRLTFPALRNFRLGRVPSHRRVFCHPAAIFFERGIANKETLEMSSLSCEYVDNSSVGFVCSVFEVPADEIMADPILSASVAGRGGDAAKKGGIIPSAAYLEREEEFDIVEAEYEELGLDQHQQLYAASTASKRTGILCRRSTDEAYRARWGPNRLAEKYGKHGINSIWDEWSRPDSGILPCAPYLRHCVLAAEKMGPVCYESFMDETYLADRVTTIREYLEQRPDVMQTVPPGDLAIRYGG